MPVTTAMVRQLREETGAGVMECKRVLTESDGDLEQARALLQQQGLASAEKLAGRAAAEGLVEAYVHPGSRIGVLVELNCETDFVARTDEFRSLAHELALQIAAMAPRSVEPKEATADGDSGDAPNGEPSDEQQAQLALLTQPYIRDPAKTIGQLISETSVRTGENVRVRRFVRYELAHEDDE